MTLPPEVSSGPDGGEAVLEAFRDLGVDYIMSSPGTEWSPVWEALARQKLSNRPGPAFIETWHETTAVNMALGYTQVTGRMQAVLLHTGIGVMHSAMGIHGARNFEIPMLVMAGESVTYGEDPNVDPGSQWHDHLGLIGGPQRIAAPITKWATQVGSVHTLYQQVVRAGEMAQRVPQAPVYLNVPLERLLEAWSRTPAAREAPRPPKTRPIQQDIEKVAKALAVSQKPILITDTGGRDADAFEALVHFAEVFAVPVMDGRVSGYANFPKDNALYVGSYNDTWVSGSDLVLLVNARAPWYPSRKRPKGATVVAISENPLKMQFPHQNMEADIYLEGDVATTLGLLVEARSTADSVMSDASIRLQQVRSEHDKMVATVKASAERGKKQESIDPIWLAAALSEVMPKDTIYVDETIVHSGVFKEHLWWNRPQSYYVVGGGLGQGTGVALGVKLAVPTRPVVLLIGDGTFLYNPVLPALGASQRHRLPVLMIVCNNGKYAAMEYGHRHFYPKGVAVSQNIWHGIHIDSPEYSEVGRLFGFHGQRIDKPSDLVDGLKAGLRSVLDGKTSILDVRLSR